MMLSSVTIYPYLPKECITTAFHLDVSARPQILDEKAALLEQIKLIRSSESFSVYCDRSANELGIDVIAARKSDDQREQENKRIISKEIESDRIYIRKLRKEQAEHPSYIQIDPIKAFSLHTDVPDINLHSDEAKLLQSVLDSLLITYEEQDLRDIMLQKDPDALVAFFLGCQLYGGAKALELDRKLAGHNDVNDLIHLLYLRNRDSLIVSEDTIFDISSMGDMRIKNDAFLELIQKLTKIFHLFHKITEIIVWFQIIQHCRLCNAIHSCACVSGQWKVLYSIHSISTSYTVQEYFW